MVVAATAVVSMAAVVTRSMVAAAVSTPLPRSMAAASIMVDSIMAAASGSSTITVTSTAATTRRTIRPITTLIRDAAGSSTPLTVRAASAGIVIGIAGITIITGTTGAIIDPT